MMKKSNDLRRAFGTITSVSASVTTGLCCVFLFLLCGRLPTDIGKNNFPIQLTLEDGTATTATFSGQPIVATVTLPDSEYFDDIAWHIGSGSYRHLGIAPVKKIKQLQVELYWTSIPLCKDTLTKRFYDTAYVSTRGETIRSNTVKVIVTNVPPMIDSVKIGTSAGRSDDTVRYSVSMNDTGSYLTLRVIAHDPTSNDILRYDWFSTRGVQMQTTPIVQYSLPKSQFSDTIFVTVYDGKGGSASKIIIITKLPPNSRPVIDSISVGGHVFLQDTSFHSYAARQLDTVKFRVYAHDSDNGDMLTYTWTKKNKKDSLMRSSSQASLICDTIYRKASDSLRTADTVTVVVKDLRGDSAKTTVRLVQGYFNTAPKLDSIRVNGLMQCRGPLALLARDSAFAWARDTFALRIYSTDPDSGDTVKLSVKAKQSSLVARLSDTTAQYICKDSAYTDTLVCIVKDLSGDSAVKKIVITVINRPPVLDSIRVNGVTQCKGPLALLARDTAIASSRDTFQLRMFAHDVDPGDTMKLRVTSKQTSCAIKLSDTSAIYVCKDSLYTDTVACIVKDLTGDSAVKKIVITVINRPPVLDSIRVNGVMQCRGTILLSRDTASTSSRDTFFLRIFAHDVDPKDSVKLSVKAKQSSYATRLSDTTAQYICMGSEYTDTIVCIVKDLSGDSAVKKIVIAVINRPPVLDSIRVNGVMQCKGTTLLARDTASGSDTLLLRMYASDPDKADSVKIFISSVQTSVLTRISDTIARYICKDSLYTDTVTCVVRDLFGDSAKKSIVMTIVNRLPKIDSLQVTDTLGNGSGTFIAADSSQSFGHDSIAAKDSVKLRLYAHDPDVSLNDSITIVQWTTSSLKAMKFLDGKGLFVQYPGQNSTYSDTVSVKVFDRKQKWTRRSIILNTR
jgi:hypothetical protein